MNQHEAFFSYTVPPRRSPPNNDQQAAASASVSPDTAHRPSTSVGHPFAFSVPPTAQGASTSPDSSVGAESRPRTAVATGGYGGNSCAGAGGFRPGVGGIGVGEGQIGTHNTRPMTAPGAGWAQGGSAFNHGYDYSSASAGLFPSMSGSSDSTATSSPHLKLSAAGEPGPVAAGGELGMSLADAQIGAWRARNTSLPSLPQHGSSSAASPAGPSSTGYPTYFRPTTHAGSTAPLGVSADAASAAAAYYASSTYGSSRPGTAGSEYGLPMYSNGIVPSVLAVPGSTIGGMAGFGDAGVDGADGGDKMFSFVQMPGAPRKRARRRYDEIERLYDCNYPGCTKAYGTLNHLNAHITMQKHGPKRLPQEFKEIRKEWRARKKAEAEARDKANRSSATAAVGPIGVEADSGPSTATPSLSLLPPVSSRPGTATDSNGYGAAGFGLRPLHLPQPYVYTGARPATAPGMSMSSLPAATISAAPRSTNSFAGPSGMFASGTSPFGYSPSPAHVAAPGGGQMGMAGGEFAYRPPSSAGPAGQGWGAYGGSSQAVETS